jgi:hypothetical protein
LCKTCRPIEKVAFHLLHTQPNTDFWSAFFHSHRITADSFDSQQFFVRCLCLYQSFDQSVSDVCNSHITPSDNRKPISAAQYVSLVLSLLFQYSDPLNNAGRTLVWNCEKNILVQLVSIYH